MAKYTWGGKKVKSTLKAPKKKTSGSAAERAAAAAVRAGQTAQATQQRQQQTQATGSPRPTPVAAPKPVPKPTPPTPPKLVDPFLTGDDLAAVADFIQNFNTSVANIDSGLRDLKIDTDYQIGQVDQAAKENSSAAADNMAARGLFQSSIKDAALYDIESNRVLQDKYLNDKMTSAITTAGTQKRILAQGKEQFDTAMAQKKVENARAVNDPLTTGYGNALTAFYNAHPELRPGAQPAHLNVPSTPAPPKPKTKPTAPVPPARPRATGTAKNVGGNKSQGAGNVHGLTGKTNKKHKVTVIAGVGKPKVGKGLY